MPEKPEPIRKDLLPAAPPSEWEFHTVLGARSDSVGTALFPGDVGPVVVRRRVTYGDWEPVRPNHWADEDVTEADVDRMLTEGVPVQIVTGPPDTFAATVDPAMCPRCKGDNTEAFELCGSCAAAPTTPADPRLRDTAPQTLDRSHCQVCGHTAPDHRPDTGACQACTCNSLRPVPVRDVMFGVPDCTCVPLTLKDGNVQACGPADTVNDIRGWNRGSDCPFHGPPGPADLGLRDRIAEVRKIANRLLAHAKGFQDILDDSDRDPWARLVRGDIERLRAAVTDLPAPADRAAVLREAAEALEARIRDEDTGPIAETWAGMDAAYLRRMADEAAQTQAHTCDNCDGIDPDTCLTR